MSSTSTNAIATRLIAAGRKPTVLGSVTLESRSDATHGVFEVLAHGSNGADGIDLQLPGAMSPTERVSIADQLADASGLAMFIRADVPMAAGGHTLILSASGRRLRAGADAVYDLEVDRAGDSPSEPAVIDAWRSFGDEHRFLVATAGFADLSDAALMGLATVASACGVSAVSSDRPRIVRRVVDTLAPVASAGFTPCR